MKLFQYAAVYSPAAEKDKPAVKPKVVVPITECLVQDQNAATIIAARAIPAEYVDKLSDIEIFVRPF